MKQKNLKQGGVKKTVQFRSEDYPEIVKAIKGLGKGLIELDLDRMVGYVHLVVKEGISLVTFDQFQGGKRERMDRHLKVQLTPYTREGSDALYQILQKYVLGDYAEPICKPTYKEGEHLTIRFSDRASKANFIASIRKQFPGDITVHERG